MTKANETKTAVCVRNPKPNVPHSERARTRAIIYARSNDPGALSKQVALLRKYAESMGWQIQDMVEDPSSGAVWRPKLAALVSRAAAREFDFLLVEAPDRISRTDLGIHLACTTMEGLGVSIATPNLGPIDLACPAILLREGIAKAVRKYDRAQMTRRIHRGQVGARSPRKSAAT